MHLGILAACLPTLKPLFASFFGQIRPFTQGRTIGSNGVSTPFRSSGYVKHDDHAGKSFAIKVLSEGSQSAPKCPNDEDVIMGKEAYSVTTNGGCSRRNRAGDSNENILSHDDGSGGLARGMAIVRTMEVSVSRSGVD
jgi:hypothetical protein